MRSEDDRPPIVILDTNVLLSYLWGSPNCSRIVRAAFVEGRFTLVASQNLVAEFSEVVERPKFRRLFDRTTQEAFRREYLLFARLVIPRCRVTICSDPDDNMVLECAAEAQADYVVTGDQGLLDIGHYGTTQIVNPVTFVGLVLGS